jgi:all-trans-retinol 13,14-reductase
MDIKPAAMDRFDVDGLAMDPFDVARFDLDGLAMARFDVVIIGSGIGGLICGNILSREGYRVCILEKNKQVGGALQTFSRDKVLFDSGVHYIGGLGPGQTLHQVFRYLEVLDHIRFTPMDGEAFDKVIIEGDDKEYALAQGYDRFEERLCVDFPGEVAAIRAYTHAIRAVCGLFPMYNLSTGPAGPDGIWESASGAGPEAAWPRAAANTDTETFIRSLTDNPILRDVLAGNNILYAGQGGKTPFYVHALILNSYIESSWKCPDGGSKISGALVRNIRGLGGEVRINAPVRKIVTEDGRVSHVLLEDGTRVDGTHFISNMHPVTTLEMTDSPLIKKAYRNRLKGLENSVSAFCLHIVPKAGSFPYFSHNYYYHRKGALWRLTDYQPEEWPLGYALFAAPEGMPPQQGPAAPAGNPVFAKSLTLMTYMKYEDVRPWQDTVNTISAKTSRGEAYEAFKTDRASRLLALAAQKFPELPGAVHSWYASTPLSYRDYLGTEDGSMYGIVKNHSDPVKTIIQTRTKIPNLYLTGQNLHLHGILGSAISALVTCSALLGSHAIIDKIKDA